MNTDVQKILSLKNLKKKYPHAEQYAVKGVSFDIHAGEIFGILGPNGAGKTTLLSMLAGLVKPSGGDFFMRGRSIHTHRREIQTSIGIVPQEYSLYPALTAFENLQFFGALYGLRGKNLSQKILEGLARVGLEAFAHKRVAHFSGGMKRRCNLLAGLLHSPEVLFLDEPTVGVDVQSRALMMAFLQEINQEGTTIVYTSHHLAEAQEFCHRIAMIDNGEILAIDSPEGLINATTSAESLEDVFLAFTGKKVRDVV